MCITNLPPTRAVECLVCEVVVVDGVDTRIFGHIGLLVGVNEPEARFGPQGSGTGPWSERSGYDLLTRQADRNKCPLWLLTFPRPRDRVPHLRGRRRG